MIVPKTMPINIKSGTSLNAFSGLSFATPAAVYIDLYPGFSLKL